MKRETNGAFVVPQEALDTLQDLQDLRDAKAAEGGAATVSLDEGRAVLGL